MKMVQQWIVINTAAAVFTEVVPDSVMTSQNSVMKQCVFEAFKEKKKMLKKQILYCLCIVDKA